MKGHQHFVDPAPHPHTTWGRDISSTWWNPHNMRPPLSDQPWQGSPGIQRGPQTQPTYTKTNGYGTRKFIIAFDLGYIYASVKNILQNCETCGMRLRQERFNTSIIVVTPGVLRFP